MGTHKCVRAERAQAHSGLAVQSRTGRYIAIAVAPPGAELFQRRLDARVVEGVAAVVRDVLLFWFGWALRIPLFVPGFVRLPFGPRMISFMARKLPRRWVRSYCSDVECLVDDISYSEDWNRAFDPRLDRDPGAWRVGRRRR